MRRIRSRTPDAAAPPVVAIRCPSNGCAFVLDVDELRAQARSEGGLVCPHCLELCDPEATLVFGDRTRAG